MSDADVQRAAKAAFVTAFGGPPTAVTHAPGRVNLLGEHTDYNGGYVLPMPLSLGTAVAMSTGEAPGTLEAVSASFEARETRDMHESATGAWTDYVLGALKMCLTRQQLGQGVRVAVASDLPLGSGLSSSAALEVAVIRAAAQIFDLTLSPQEVAVLARKAENDFVGLPCGIMDQFSVSVGTPGEVIFLDSAKLAFQTAPLVATHRIVVVHSGAPHKLTEAGYETRVLECTAAVAALGVETLSDLSLEDLDRLTALEDPLGRRARHVVTENDRALQGVAALRAGDAAAFGELMLASHASQRDDYEVSVPQVDALVAGAMAAGATGARLTGGGFGGAIVALVPNTETDRFTQEIVSSFAAARVLAVV